MSKKRNASAAGKRESINKTGSHSQSDSPAGDNARISEKTQMKRRSRREAEKHDPSLVLEKLDHEVQVFSEILDRAQQILNHGVQELLRTVIGDPDLPDLQALSPLVTEIKTQFGIYLIEKNGSFKIAWYDSKVGNNRLMSTGISVDGYPMPPNNAFADYPTWWCKSNEWRKLLTHLWSKVHDVNKEKVKSLGDVKEGFIKGRVRHYLLEELIILLGQGYSLTEAESYIRDCLTETIEWLDLP